MLDIRKFKAVGMMAARQARDKAASDDTAANEIIDMTALLEPWTEGAQTAGNVVVYNGYPYKVVQTHDSTGNPDWNPANTPALFAPYHATDKAHALPWVAPTGAHDAYNAGEWMIWMDGLAYECKQNATVHDPSVLPDAWEVAENGAE